MFRSCFAALALLVVFSNPASAWDYRSNFYPQGSYRQHSARDYAHAIHDQYVHGYDNTYLYGYNIDRYTYPHAAQRYRYQHSPHYFSQPQTYVNPYYNHPHPRHGRRH